MLNKENEWVICRNCREFRYMIGWCQDHDLGTPYLGEPSTYPIVIITCEPLAGWSNSLSREANYISFANFVVTKG